MFSPPSLGGFMCIWILALCIRLCQTHLPILCKISMVVCIGNSNCSGQTLLVWDSDEVVIIICDLDSFETDGELIVKLVQVQGLSYPNKKRIVYRTFRCMHIFIQNSWCIYRFNCEANTTQGNKPKLFMWMGLLNSRIKPTPTYSSTYLIKILLLFLRCSTDLLNKIIRFLFNRYMHPYYYCSCKSISFLWYKIKSPQINCLGI